MVRIITCHHFAGQKIGKCEEVLNLTVADNYIVVALEHQVAIYSSDIPTSDLSLSRSGTSRVGSSSGVSAANTQDLEDVGSVPTYFNRPSGNSNTSFSGNAPSANTNVNGQGSQPYGYGNELKFSHSFPTVDLIDFVSYNRRGNYLLCLEKRDSNTATQPGSNSVSDQDKRKINKSIRIYFNWDNATDGKPMKARIAGLVSPTGTEPDHETLLMVEIPQLPQALSPSTGGNNSVASNVIAVASCNILGHLASLTESSVVNIYSFRLKDGKARGRIKSQYADFDFSYTIELMGFPQFADKCLLGFLANVITVSNSGQVHIFKMTKHTRNRVRSISNDSGSSAGSGSVSGSTGGRVSASSAHSNSYLTSGRVSGVGQVPMSGACAATDISCTEICDKVVFDPKNESIKVYLNTITRANQKRKFPDVTSGVYEEYQEEILPTNRSRLLYSAGSQPLLVEDLLRVSIGQEFIQSQVIIKVGLYPVRIKDDLGGVSCIVGTSSQAFVYHLPVKREAIVSRVVIYPLTAPLVSFSFDSLFFHALTETGLESYTSRSLYYPIKEFEGLTRYVNECPFRDETPTLVGIRPFIGVRHMAANEFLLCLLASPKTQSNSTEGTSSGGGTSTENALWTIYALQLPSIDMLYEDISKAALQAKTSSLETYTTLMTELHLVLRAYMNSNPETEANHTSHFKDTCKVIGIELFKSASLLFEDAKRLSDGSDKHRKEHGLQPETYLKEQAADELLDKGVTYLNMAGLELKSIFEEDFKIFMKDKKMIRGVTRFINVMLPQCVNMDSSFQNTLSPKLAAAVTDFLLAHSTESLVHLVINVNALRESNSAKLLPILKRMAEGSGYQKEESLALLLTVVTMSGCDQATRSQAKEILNKCKSKDFENSIDLNWLLDLKTPSKAKIMDLTVCMSSAKSPVPALVLSRGLKSSEITIGQVMLAFSQGINLNAETQVQQSLTRTLTLILEDYFTDKLKQLNLLNGQGGGTSIILGSRNKSNFVSVQEPKLVNIENNTKVGSDSKKVGFFAGNVQIPLSEDETRAVQALVRSYLSHVNIHSVGNGSEPTVYDHSVRSSNVSNSNQAIKIETTQNVSTGANPTTNVSSPGQHTKGNVPLKVSAPTNISEESEGKTSQTLDNATVIPLSGGSGNKNVILPEQKVTLFGKVPNFFSHIIKETYGLTTGTATSFQILSTMPMVSEESREYFIKASSLLASPLVNAGGVREIILTFLDTKGQSNSTLHVCLQLMVEPTEKAIGLLISKYPLAIMYYAKEMFGTSTSKWKILVSKLKDKIKSNSDNVDTYATIIESVYLYLAFYLSPTELEEVLDKGEENSRFFKACRRTELANSYNSMVMQMSNEYLN